MGQENIGRNRNHTHPSQRAMKMQTSKEHVPVLSPTLGLWSLDAFVCVCVCEAQPTVQGHPHLHAASRVILEMY